MRTKHPDTERQPHHHDTDLDTEVLHWLATWHDRLGLHDTAELLRLSEKATRMDPPANLPLAHPPPRAQSPSRAETPRGHRHRTAMVGQLRAYEDYMCERCGECERWRELRIREETLRSEDVPVRKGEEDGGELDPEVLTWVWIPVLVYLLARI